MFIPVNFAPFGLLAGLLAITFSIIEFSSTPKNSRTKVKQYLIWGTIVTGAYVCFFSYISLSLFSSPDGSNQSDLLGLLLGLTGVIITALTGMALATAWRAKDEAKNALERMELEYNTMRVDLYRSIAFAELLMLKMQNLNQLNTDRVEKSVISNLINAVSSTKPSQAIFYIEQSFSPKSRRLSSARVVVNENSSIQKYMETLLKNGNLDTSARKVIRTILS